MSGSSRRIAINAGGTYVSGLNAVLAGAVLAAHELGCEIFGINDGYEGLLFRARYPDRGLPKLTNGAIAGFIDGAGASLGTSRIDPFHVRQVTDDYVDEVDRSDELLGALRNERIEGVISVVDRRAMSVAWKLERKGLKTVCVPESVENDVAATAYSFGFNSALSFSIELLDRIRNGARASHRIAVVEVLGEHTGWLALQAGIAALADAVLIPEMPYNLDKVAERLLRNQRDGRCPALVVVAEGARPAGDGKDSAGRAEGASENIRRALSPGSSPEGTSHGRRVIRRAGAASEAVAPELQRRTNIESFSFALDQVLRGGPTTAVDRQIGLAYGAAAVRGLADGRTGEMVAFQPPHLAFVPLAQAVNKVRTVPVASEFVLSARSLGISLGI
jgi:6-phosphofructokinase 1